MSKWILIEIEDNGTKTALPTEFPTWDAACTAQEAAEEANPNKAYLILTVDEWVYEMENGRA